MEKMDIGASELLEGGLRRRVAPHKVHSKRSYYDQERHKYKP